MEDYGMTKILISDYEEDPVESLSVGVEPTYDIEVEDNHHYLLDNGIVSHNTLTEIVEAGGGGVEPIFAKFFVRRERSTTHEWKEWFTFNHAVRRVFDREGLEYTKENVDRLTSEDYWVTAHNVSNEAKIRMMSKIQEYIDSSISVTYNLDKDATPEDIEKIYFQAWENELKNVSVFRESSKMGVLITDANYEESKNEELDQKVKSNRFSPERPEVVECDIHKLTANKEPFIVLVGKVEDVPYEVFVTDNLDEKIDVGKHKKGYIKKVKKGHYQLMVKNGEETVMVDDLKKQFNTDYGTLSRFISMSLRHGVPVEFIVDQLSKDRNFLGFEKSLGRVLKKYIQEGKKVSLSEKCPDCGSENLVYQEGCKTCVSCGWSKCD